MEKRLTFNEDVLNYDKCRPRYCDELFSDIINYAGLDPEKLCLEIGCGTGQATEPILKIGSSVIAVELSYNMVEYSIEKFKNYNNFQIKNMDFENYDCDVLFDFIYSATAFHWIDEKIGYPKVFNLLKNKGTLALFWNRTRPTADHVHLKINEVYKKYRDYIKYVDVNSIIENDTELYENIKNTIMKYGFVDVELHLYKGTRSFDADEYISLLNTYPDHVSIPEPIKSQFLSDIKKVIQNFDNIIKINDKMDLYLAKKP